MSQVHIYALNIYTRYTYLSIIFGFNGFITMAFNTHFIITENKNLRPLPKQIQRIRQTSVESNSSDHGPRGQRTASVRLISSTSSHLSDLPEDLVVGNDDVIDEAETDGFEGTIQIKSLIELLSNCCRSAVI